MSAQLLEYLGLIAGAPNGVQTRILAFLLWYNAPRTEHASFNPTSCSRSASDSLSSPNSIASSPKPTN
jgi:hypothetical protein